MQNNSYSCRTPNVLTTVNLIESRRHPQLPSAFARRYMSVRVRAVDSDKATRALEDAGHLEAALQAERRAHAEAAAVADKEAAAADLRYRQQIDALTKQNIEADIQLRQQIEALKQVHDDADLRSGQQIDALTKANVDADLQNRHQIDALKRDKVDADLHHRQQIDALTQARVDADLQNRQQIDALTKAHAEAMETLSLQAHESAELAKREGAELLAKELALVRENAAQEHRQWCSEFEYTAELERSKLAETHQEEMAAVAERYRAETQEAMERAVTAEACAAESVATDMSNLRKQHAKELADAAAAAETTRVEQLRRFQDELDEERAIALKEAKIARDDRRTAELKREKMFQEVTEKVETAAKETGAKALDDLQRQFDVELARLNEAHEVAVKTAVGEATERLREEHGATMATAIAERETYLLERHLEEVKLAEADHSAREAAAITALNAEHDRDMTSLRNENAADIAKLGDDADVRRTADLAAAAINATAAASAAKSESLRRLEELEQSHREKLAAAEKRHVNEVSHAIEAEKTKGKAELAQTASASTAAIATLEEEMSAARIMLENKHRDELATVRENHETEMKAIAAEAERRDKKFREDATQQQKALLAEAQTAADKVVTSLNNKHAKDLADAKHRFQVDLDTAISEAEHRRQADIEALETRSSANLADANEAAAATLAAEKEKHQGEILSIEAEHKSEIDKLLVRADGKLGAERAAAADALSRALAEASAEHHASLKDVKAQHGEELSAYLEAHERDKNRIAHDAAKKREAYMADANEHLLSSLAAMKAEMTSAAATQNENNLEVKRKMEEGYATEIDRVAAAAESRRVRDIAELRKQHAKSLAEAEETTAASMSRLKLDHEAEIANLKRVNTENEARILKESEEKRATEIETLTRVFEEGKTKYEDQMDVTLVALENRRLEELTAAQEKHDAELESIKKAAEEKIAAEGARMSTTTVELIAEQTAKTVRLHEEHAEKLAAVSRIAETRRFDDLANAERRFEADLDAFKKGLAEEKATFITHHLLDLRKVKEEGDAEVKRVSSAAGDRYAALEAETIAALSQVKANHLEEMQAASSAAEEARMIERNGFEKILALTKAEKVSVEDEIKQREEQHQCDLRRIDDENKAEMSAELTAASERHDKALASALAEANIAAETLRTASLAAQEEKFTEILQKERSAHAGSVSVAEALCATVKADATSQKEALISEHLLAVETIKNAHRAAVEELEERHRIESNEMEKRIEGAEIAAVEAQASADELGTRAAALDEMLRTSVGSKEHELAGHRSRVAQLQAFVARREGAEDNALSPAAARSVQQRVIDLRAMAAGAGAGGLKVGVGETGLDAFARTGLVEGLTLERYVEELETVLVRATVESAAARQDHLEADMQHQSVTRQLVGLKVRCAHPYSMACFAIVPPPLLLHADFFYHQPSLSCTAGFLARPLKKGEVMHCKAKDN